MVHFAGTSSARTTRLRVKEDIEDVSSEMGNGAKRLHFYYAQNSIALGELGSNKTSSRFMATIKCVKERLT
ncbi:hypothetical protein TNCV_690681 [Trichonephila clavipes]|nr:hypothetical protein TNCV_690681 [Trichonephila clavipes]